MKPQSQQPLQGLLSSSYYSWIKIVLMIIVFISACRSDDTKDKSDMCSNPFFREFVLRHNLCPNITDPPTTTTPTPPPLPHGGRYCHCGVPKAQGRIIGGWDVRIGETPWHVGLTTDPSEPFFCGGSIINEQWVLTAAHCFYRYIIHVACFKHQYSQLYVGLGYYEQFNTDDIKGSHMAKVQQQIPHPKFNCYTMDNDFALVQLQTSLYLGDYAYVPICLPEDDNRHYAYEHAMIIGWGFTAENGKLSDKLKKGDVRIWNEYCKGFVKTDNMLCAKGMNKIIDGKEVEVDACQGDSGGSLSIVEQGQYTQVGITSFGKGCARTGKPGVYARVSKALEWIHQVAGWYCVRL